MYYIPDDLNFFDDSEIYDEMEECPFGGYCNRSHCDGCAIFDAELEEITTMDPFFE